jgi:para-nitrobenzyl esterase
LTVNVWTPDLRTSTLPVMVWIYGGAFTIGSSDQPEFDGASLAAQRIVVVSLNYRVGVEGFMQIEGAPSNRGGSAGS